MPVLCSLSNSSPLLRQHSTVQITSSAIAIAACLTPNSAPCLHITEPNQDQLLPTPRFKSNRHFLSLSLHCLPKEIGVKPPGELGVDVDNMHISLLGVPNRGLVVVASLILLQCNT